MSNYALQLDANAHCAFTTNSGVQAATKLVARIRVLGACLGIISADFGLVEIGSGADRKVGVSVNSGSGTTAYVHFRTPGAESDTLVLPAVTSTNYYELEVSFDPSLGANRCVATLYDTDGTTVLGTASGNYNSLTTALPTTTGASIVTVGDWGLGGNESTHAETVDWLHITDGTTTVFDAEFNEGSGTTTADSAGGTTGTVTGSSSWIALSSTAKLAPPQGNGGSYQ